jgi:hypothetical protein
LNQYLVTSNMGKLLADDFFRLESAQYAKMTYTLIVDLLVPATLKVTVFASLSYVISKFWTVISDPDKHSLNPEVFKIWAARPLPERVPSNSKEIVEKEMCWNMMSRATGLNKKSPPPSICALWKL